MVKEHFLFLLPLEGIEPLVTMVMSTELFKGGSVKNNDNNQVIQVPFLPTESYKHQHFSLFIIIIYFNNQQLQVVVIRLHCDWLMRPVMWLAESVSMIQSVCVSAAPLWFSSKDWNHWPGVSPLTWSQITDLESDHWLFMRDELDDWFFIWSWVYKSVSMWAL